MWPLLSPAYLFSENPTQANICQKTNLKKTHKSKQQTTTRYREYTRHPYDVTVRKYVWLGEITKLPNRKITHGRKMRHWSR